MQSLFDPVDDIKLPDERPKRNYKKFFMVLGIIAGVAVLGAGSYMGYRYAFPPPLTERPIPRNAGQLMAELKGARDGIDLQTREIYERIQQFNGRMKRRGEKSISFSQVFLAGLSSEEEAALDALVRQEKDPSYRGILQQVVQDMKKIRDLETRVVELEALLPDDGIEVQRGDSHIKLAKKWLVERQGIPETRAEELSERLNLMEAGLKPGFTVHFYYDPVRDFFGTWVAQGSSDRTPIAVMRARRMKLIGQRDAAIARGDDLEEQKEALLVVKAGLEEDINALEVRKANLETNVADLEGKHLEAVTRLDITERELKVQRNSLFYEADLEERLKARGVLRVFNNIEDIGNAEFNSSLDLSKSKSIKLEPSQFGIGKIRDVRIVPKFLQEGRELDIKFEEDGTVQITVLDEKTMKGQKVIFVVK